jgi:hypothetical protein
MAIGFSPLAATKFPTGGHHFSPLVAIRSPRWWPSNLPGPGDRPSLADVDPEHFPHKPHPI